MLQKVVGDVLPLPHEHAEGKDRVAGGSIGLEVLLPQPQRSLVAALDDLLVEKIAASGTGPPVLLVDDREILLDLALEPSGDAIERAADDRVPDETVEARHPRALRRREVGRLLGHRKSAGRKWYGSS